MKCNFKKTLLACVALSASAAVLADDDGLTIYGKLDNAVERIQIAGERVTRLQSSGSYLGFTGKESLGDGLKVGFLLESNFQSDNGATSEDAFFNNGAEVFLESEAGTLRLGRYFNPSYYAVADRVSLHHGDSGVSLDWLYAGVENDSNRVGYKSPEWGGLTVEGAISLHEDNADLPRKNAYDLALNYDVGNWSFGAGYGKWDVAKQWALRATWSDGPWTVAAYHQRSQEWDAMAYAVTPDDGKRNVTRVALSYAWEGSDVHANFGRANGPQGQHAKQWTLGYNYHLSQRTKLYALYTTISNHNGASYGIDGMQANDQLKAVSIGVRHLF